MTQAFISFIRHALPVPLSVKSVQCFFRDRMCRNDFLGERFQVHLTLALCFLFAGFGWDYLVFLRFTCGCVTKRIRLIKERQLPVNGLHGFRAAPKTVLAGNPYLLYELFDIFV